MSVWPYECRTLWVYNLMSLWPYEFMTLWVYDLMSLWPYECMTLYSRYSVGPYECRTLYRQSDNQTIRQSDNQTIGQSDNQRKHIKTYHCGENLAPYSDFLCLPLSTLFKTLKINLWRSYVARTKEVNTVNAFRLVYNNHRLVCNNRAYNRVTM